jgi:hypothetical protein
MGSGTGGDRALDGPDPHVPPSATLALMPTQERFDVDIKPLPASIDASTYMNQA